MKAERINKNQVRFTLNRADLRARHLKIADLSYGSDKTRALFEDMMQQAITEFGFDLSGHPVMIEAIPISEDSLMITMTQVNGQEDLISLFRSNVPGADQGPGELDLRFQQTPEEPQEAKEAPTEVVILYTFDSFDTLMEAVHTIPASLRLRNVLYHEVDTGRYHLKVHLARQTRQLRYVLTALTEFAAEVSRDPLRIAYIEEHASTTIKARALQKLHELETE